MVFSYFHYIYSSRSDFESFIVHSKPGPTELCSLLHSNLGLCLYKVTKINWFVVKNGSKEMQWQRWNSCSEIIWFSNFYKHNNVSIFSVFYIHRYVLQYKCTMYIWVVKLVWISEMHKFSILLQKQYFLCG